MEVFLDFLSDPAPVIGLSCMANLLPFTILAIRALRERYPGRKIILGGVGAKSVKSMKGTDKKGRKHILFLFLFALRALHALHGKNPLRISLNGVRRFLGEFGSLLWGCGV